MPILVQLWTTGNYHWYLKQSLKFEGPEHRVGAVLWDPEHEYRLHVMCNNGGYYRYTWAWGTSHSTDRDSGDQGIVAVIDGGMWHLLAHYMLLFHSCCQEINLVLIYNGIWYCMWTLTRNWIRYTVIVVLLQQSIERMSFVYTCYTYFAMRWSM